MRLLITAGPTREPIDAVRFIGNRSSGRLGVALARHAAEAGHDVTLLLGPVSVHLPRGDRLRVERFESTAQLQALLDEHFPGCDALVMAAAVADYTPARRIEGKTERGEGLTLELQPTPDLVAGLASRKRDDQRVIAFALEEPANLERRAQEKMRRKRVDAIVANPLKTMDADTIEPTLYLADGSSDTPGAMSKTDFASWLTARIERMVESS